MKKTILVLFLVVCLLIPGMTACGDSVDSTTASPTNTETTVTTSSPANTTTTATSTITTSEPSTITFTDSLGREVEIPSEITKVALSGPLTQIVLFALCPDRIVGLSNAWDPSAEGFLDTEYYNLPILGQLYGTKGTLNLETIAATGAQIIIDVGETKANMDTDMDNLQQQLGIPAVHIAANTQSIPQAYRELGALLGLEEKAEILADYCDEIYTNTIEIMNKIGEEGKAGLLYCLGDRGINVSARGSYQAEIIDLIADNLAVVENPTAKGTGNEVDLEQIILWDPEYILFAPDSIYSTVGDNPAWADITAIKNGNYFEVPLGPYNWMGFPPSVQRYLGMMWLSQLLYPDTAQYDMYQEVSRYFELFYHCGITEEQYASLVANSLGKL